MTHHRKGHKKNPRVPKINTREKKQRDFKSVNDNKKLAWQHLFGNMSAEDIIAELNSTWIDSRYQLQIIEPQEPIVCDGLGLSCDGAILFQGWEVQSTDLLREVQSTDLLREVQSESA